MFDLSGYSQMGAIGSDLSWSMLGERGPSIYGAAGAAAYVEVPDLDVQDTIRTATFWYASNMAAWTYSGLLSKNVAATNIGLVISNRDSGNYSVYATNQASSQFPLAQNTWCQITVVDLHLGSPNLYINGVQITEAWTNGWAAVSTDVLRIGYAYYSSAARPLRGWLNDVRLYNHSLTSLEVYQQWSPETRWDLYLPAAPRFWSVPAAAPPAGAAIPIFGSDAQLFGSVFGGAIVR